MSENTENTGVEMNPEDLKLLIEENEMLKHELKVMNSIPLSNRYSNGEEVDEDTINYQELWSNVALSKRIDAGEPNVDLLTFYFKLLSDGYDNFGLNFFIKMANSENDVHLYNALVCFLDYMSDYNEGTNQDS